MKNLLFVALLPAGLFADEVNVSNFGTSNCADTEIATNIAFQVDNNMFNRLELLEYPQFLTPKNNERPCFIG